MFNILLLRSDWFGIFQQSIFEISLQSFHLLPSSLPQATYEKDIHSKCETFTELD
jgi:hypothetical protein